MTAEEVIRTLQLEPHADEGGYFREIYKSKIFAKTPAPHVCGTSINYLMTHNDFSHWHRVDSDELWIYTAGTPAIQLLLFPGGHWEERRIGPDFAGGETNQSIIPAGVWQAAVLADRTPGNWGLFAAVVCPGFEFSDYAHGNAEELLANWPEAAPRARELSLD